MTRKHTHVRVTRTSKVAEHLKTRRLEYACAVGVITFGLGIFVHVWSEYFFRASEISLVPALEAILSRIDE